MELFPQLVFPTAAKVNVLYGALHSLGENCTVAFTCVYRTEPGKWQTFISPWEIVRKENKIKLRSHILRKCEREAGEIKLGANCATNQIS